MVSAKAELGARRGRGPSVEGFPICGFLDLVEGWMDSRGALILEPLMLLCCFSGDRVMSTVAAAFFRGDLRRVVLAPVAIKGVGARIALRSGNSSSEE